MKTVLLFPLMGLIIILSSCTPATIESAKRSGESPLDARELFNLVSGNSLSLNAYDFIGIVYFDPGGKIGGIDNEGQKDTGRWDITEQNQLCMKFKVWYYGDLKCYSVVSAENDGLYSFFTPNGAAYYKGVLKQGDKAELQATIKKQQSSKYLRESLAAEAVQQKDTTPPPSGSSSSPVIAQPVENNAKTTVRQIAQNCPGCNLAGADLKEAILIGAQLDGANLAGADLRYANLRRAHLAGANLSGARLNYANLPGADLSGSNLRNADFSGANLLLTDFTGADLSGAKLENAHMENTKGIEK